MSEDKSPMVLHRTNVPVVREVKDDVQGEAIEKINWAVMLKRCIGEALGTAVLVAVGCGAAIGLTLVGSAIGSVAVATAFAFGLVVTALSYALGEFTGCHVNPAVTFALWMDGRIGWKQAILYTISQNIGAIAGAALLLGIFGNNWDWTNPLLENVADTALVETYASNSVSGLLIDHFGMGSALTIGFFAEVFFALVFVFTILCTSHDKANKGFSGIALGLSLSSIVFFGFGITGTGLNPARSLGTALMAMINNQFKPINEIWIFILGPFVGAALAVVCYWAVWHDYGPHFPHSNKPKPIDRIKKRIDSKEGK